LPAHADRIAAARAAISDVRRSKDEDITILELLAEGSFGKVYKGCVPPDAGCGLGLAAGRSLHQACTHVELVLCSLLRLELCMAGSSTAYRACL